jgi:hypothetical protein
LGRGSERRQRGRRITIRLTEAERAALDTAAERAGLSLGSHIRKVLLEAPLPRQARRPPIEKTELARLLGHIGKIGSNINQLAREVNSDGIDAFDRIDFQTATDDLAAMRAALMEALGRSPRGDPRGDPRDDQGAGPTRPQAAPAPRPKGPRA